MTTLWNEKLNTHPYKLISLIALIDATYFLIYNTIENICNFKLYTIFAYTVLWDGSESRQKESLIFLINISILLFRFLFMLSFLLNSFLCLDLYLTVKNPFYPAHRRMKFYILYSVIVTLPTVFWELWKFGEEGASAETAEEVTMLIAFVIFVTVAIITTVFASKRILRPGVSQEVRSTVISRHIKYIVMIFVTFSAYAVKIFIKDILHDNNDYPALDVAGEMLFASQGILLSMLRLSEPLVW